VIIQQRAYRGDDVLLFGADNPSVSGQQRFRPFGILAQYEQWRTECRRLLLHPTRVGKHSGSLEEKLHEFRIAKGCDQMDVLQAGKRAERGFRQDRVWVQHKEDLTVAALRNAPHCRTNASKHGAPALPAVTGQQQ
jgi:hypothetical protein